MTIFNLQWILLILIVFNCSSVAENNFSSPVSTQDSAQHFNKNGIQVYLINGISFALKTRSSYPHSWRLLFDLQGNLTSSTSEYREKTSGDLYQQSEGKNQIREFSISSAFQYNYFFGVKDYFDPYVGIGPIINYGIQRGKYHSENLNGGTTNQTDETKRIQLGIGALSSIGVESSLLTYLSFFIELNLTYIQEWLKTENNSSITTTENWREYEVTATSNSFELQSVKLGLIIYF